MFMLSIRLSRKRMLLGALALVLVVTLGVTGAKRFGRESSIPAAVTAEKVTGKKNTAKTNDQRLEFIKSFGWEVIIDPVEVMEVVIPEKFDDVYNQYNSIQKMQGCDLESFRGKRCKRYSYEVTNYPGQTENVRINLLVYNNKIIGGDVCSMVAGGFMHGFSQK